MYLTFFDTGFVSTSGSSRLESIFRLTTTSPPDRCLMKAQKNFRADRDLSKAKCIESSGSVPTHQLWNRESLSQ